MDKIYDILETVAAWFSGLLASDVGLGAIMKDFFDVVLGAIFDF